MLRWLWAALVLVLVTACPHPRTARMDALAEPDPIELDAKRRIAERTCVSGIGVVFPGIGAMCDGKPAEGAALMTIGAIDLASAIAIPIASGAPYAGGDMLPLIWLQDAYVTAWVSPALDRHLAEHRRYVPRDTLGELTFAPFNGHVLKRPVVWGGTLGILAGAIAVTALIPTEEQGRLAPHTRINWFGADLPDGVGWPLVTVTQAYTFEHVAIAEETLFRGLIQSSLSRGAGRWGGWALGSLIFGVAHATNALTMTTEDAVTYLIWSVPYITVAGAVMGLAYMDARYSLTSSVAMHFWYDFALSMLGTIVDPANNPVAARISGRF